MSTCGYSCQHVGRQWVPDAHCPEHSWAAKPAAPPNDPLTKEAEASVRLDGDTHCVDDAPQSDPRMKLIDLVKAHKYCYGEELRHCQCGQVTLDDAEWQEHFAHVLSLYVAPAPQSDQLGPNVYRGDDGVDRVLGISSGLLPPSDQPEQGRPLDELNELIAIADRDGTLDIRPGLKRIAAKLAAPASQPIAPAQPERSAIDEANSILYPNRTPSSGADARELIEDEDGAPYSDDIQKSVAALWKLVANHYDWKAEAAALLESFRAETRAQWDSELAGAYQMHDEMAVRAETLEQAAQHIRSRAEAHRTSIQADKGERFNKGMADICDSLDMIAEQIRTLHSDPNWLARQIAAAKKEEANWWHANCPNCMAGTYCNGKDRIASIESASAKLGDKGESR